MRPWLREALRCPFTGGHFSVEALDEDDGRLRHGVLTSEAGAFPVIAGIPVLRAPDDHLVDLVRAGEWDRAARVAAFGEIPPAGAARVGPWFAATAALRPVGDRLVARHRARLDEAALALTDPATTTRELFTLAYEDLHLRNPEVAAYNWCRFALPRHLATLGVLAGAPARGPVLDLGCGAGHLTWALARHVAPAPVVGVDGLFFALYVAATRLAPEADFVCVDLDALPLADDAMAGVFASDVFHALARKAPVAREMTRVATRDGWGLVTGLAVAGHDHEYRGRPLSIEGYRAVLPERAAVLDDDLLLAAYLDGRGADRTRDRAGPEATVVSLVWGGHTDDVALDPAPHGEGTLVPNPLFAVAAVDATGAHLTLRFPTASHEREHGALRTYTAATASVTPTAAAAAARGERTTEVTALIDRYVVVGAPAAFWPDAWAALASTDGGG